MTIPSKASLTSLGDGATNKIMYKSYIGVLLKCFAQTSKYIDCLTVHTACLVCFISTVNGSSKKERKEAY